MNIDDLLKAAEYFEKLAFQKLAYPIKLDREYFESFLQGACSTIINYVFETFRVRNMDQLRHLPKDRLQLGIEKLSDRDNSLTSTLRVKKIVGKAGNGKTYYNEQLWTVIFTFTAEMGSTRGIASPPDKFMVIYLAIPQLLAARNEDELFVIIDSNIREAVRHELTHAMQYADLDFRSVREKIERSQKLSPVERKLQKQMETNQSAANENATKEQIAAYHNLPYEQEAFHAQVEEGLESLLYHGMMSLLISRVFQSGDVSLRALISAALDKTVWRHIQESYSPEFQNRVMKTAYKFFEDHSNEIVKLLANMYNRNKNIFAANLGEKLENLKPAIKANQPGLLNMLFSH